MQLKAIKYLLDIESAIAELEAVKARVGNEFQKFQEDILMLRAAERGLEIIGEAVRKLTDQFPEVHITSSRKIIGLRNIIAHSYDSVEPELIWSILLKDIPVLSQEIKLIKNLST